MVARRLSGAAGVRSLAAADRWACWPPPFVFLGAFTYGIVYTVWLKRRSTWNIVVGGLAGSFAVLAGAAAVDPRRRWCRPCWRSCCSCGRRRISGASRPPRATTMPRPACRCCRWWPGACLDHAPFSPIRSRWSRSRWCRSGTAQGLLYGLGAGIGGGYLRLEEHRALPRPDQKRMRWPISSLRCCSSRCSIAGALLDERRRVAGHDARRARRCGRGVLACSSSGSAVTAAAANVARLDPRRAIERSEQAIGRTLGNYTLTDSTGARRSRCATIAASRWSSASSIRPAARFARRRPSI